jgi:hypothetical protein
LQQSDLNASLQDLAGLDTAEARRQIIEQWVTRTLLLQEALAMNLEDTPAVRKRLEEQERAVLVTALTSRIYDAAEVAPTREEIEAYFERHRDRLRLREPYVRVRYLVTRRAETAERIREQMQEQTAAPGADTSRAADALWQQVAREHALDPERAQRLSQQYVPVSRLFIRNATLRATLSRLRAGDLAPVVSTDSLHHVLHLVERIPEGSAPELAWVEPEIRRRLVVRARKQMYAREVQRLRNEAKARNALEIR